MQNLTLEERLYRIRERRKKKYRKIITVSLSLVFVFLMLTLNTPFSLKANLASEKARIGSADMMANFIVSEYNRQIGNYSTSNVDVSKIIEEAKKLNDYKLQLHYDKYSNVVLITKDIDINQLVYKEVKLN